MPFKKIRLNLIDAIIFFFIAAFVFYLFYRIKSGINYKWNWSVIPEYLFRYDVENAKWVPNLIMQGFFTTIRLSVWATIFATILGAAMGFCRISKSLFWRMIGRSYVEIIRNIPPLVLIFIFYFFIGDQVMTAIGADSFVRSASQNTKTWINFFFSAPQHFSAFLSAVITLALYEGAYITEIIRAGIQSIEKGQWEASAALGFSKAQQMRHIILPQAVQRILPPLAGQFISTIKDSAIVSVISIQELTFQGMELMAATYLTFEIWITITFLYFILTFGCSLLVGKMERQIRKF